MRKYIDARDISILSCKGVTLTIRLPGGEILEGAEPRRLFPVSDANRHIGIIDANENEMFIIRDATGLDAQSLALLNAALERYYMVPRIEEITEIRERFGHLAWKIRTDRGSLEIRIKDRHSDIRQDKKGRVLIRDSNDNRYEIPDAGRLPKRSRNMLTGEL